jgi:hypothetical protein
MSEYFLKIEKLWPKGSVPQFYGPYQNKWEAENELERLQTMPPKNLEVLTRGEDRLPQDLSKAIVVEIMTKTAARNAGLKSPIYGDKKNFTLVNKFVPGNLGVDDITDVKIEERPEPQKVATPTSPEATTAPAETDKSKPQAPVERSQEDYEVEFEESERWIEEPEEEQGQTINPDDVVIVTPYPSTVVWLKRRGIEGRVLRHVNDSEQIRGKIVIGSLPPPLSVKARLMGYLRMPRLRSEQRNTILTPDEMDEAGANILWYTVKEVRSPF